MLELQQDHCRTLLQVDCLKRALDEHSLELRVKAANEAEAACQQRLAAAEAEIAEQRQRLDDSERFGSSLWIQVITLQFLGLFLIDLYSRCA
jgi:E3 ubiquitin-protein ligase BRE1